jgi:hypothetical protein
MSFLIDSVSENDVTGFALQLRVESKKS